MNDEFDALEAELAALQPRRPSPELERRVAAELWPRPSARHRTAALAALAIGTVAAGLLAAIWLSRGDRGTAVAQPPRPPIHFPVETALDSALPSVWSFRPVCVDPAGDLDALLDRHAGRTPAERTHYVQIRGFGVSETERQKALGDL